MAGLDLHGRAVIATSPAQQCAPRWKAVRSEPHPGLLRVRDGPGRRIHHHEPQPGHRLHHIPAQLDHCRLSDIVEEPLPRLPAAPIRGSGGQRVVMVDIDGGVADLSAFKIGRAHV